jgi:hypothetical protein
MTLTTIKAQRANSVIPGDFFEKPRKFATIKKNTRKSNSLSLFSCYSRLSREMNVN